MAVTRKTAPVGIDFEIDKAQVHFSGKIAANSSQWNPRVYINPFEKSAKTSNRKPEHFVIGSLNEYLEQYTNDLIDLHVFFVASENPELDNTTGDVTQRVSMIIQANLKNMYPSISHRADEELHMAFYNAWNKWNLKTRFQFVNYETGIDNVFREFETNKIIYSDLHPRHCVRFNFDVRYVPKCCTDC